MTRFYFLPVFQKTGTGIGFRNDLAALLGIEKTLALVAAAVYRRADIFYLFSDIPADS